MNAYFFKKVGLSFVRAFVPAFAIGLTPAADAVAAGDWNTARAAVVACVLAGGAAVLRALQALGTNLETDAAQPGAAARDPYE